MWWPYNEYMTFQVLPCCSGHWRPALQEFCNWQLNFHRLVLLPFFSEYKDCHFAIRPCRQYALFQDIELLITRPWRRKQYIWGCYFDNWTIKINQLISYGVCIVRIWSSLILKLHLSASPILWRSVCNIRSTALEDLPQCWLLSRKWQH